MGISLLVLFVGADVRSARAQAPSAGAGTSAPAPVGLRVTADGACGDAARFDAHLRQFLGLGEGDPAPLADAAIEVRIDAELDGYRLSLTGTIGDGTPLERRLVHPRRCDLLLEVAALVVAMAIDPDAAMMNARAELFGAGLEAAPPDEPTPADPPPTPVPTELAVAPDTPPEVPSEPVVVAAGTDAPVVGLSLGLGVAEGHANSTGGALRAGVSRTSGHARFGAGVAVFAPGRADASGLSGARLALVTVGLSIDACYVASRGRLQVPLCARGDAGLVHARPIGIPSPETALRPSLRVGVAPSVRYAVGERLALVAEAGLSFAALRPSFGVHNLGTVATVPLVGVDATLGVEARWP